MPLGSALCRSKTDLPLRHCSQIPCALYETLTVHNKVQCRGQSCTSLQNDPLPANYFQGPLLWLYVKPDNGTMTEWMLCRFFIRSYSQNWSCMLSNYRFWLVPMRGTAEDLLVYFDFVLFIFYFCSYPGFVARHVTPSHEISECSFFGAGLNGKNMGLTPYA